MRPAQRGTVLLQVSATMGIRMTQPHWVIEGLDFQGVCTSHDDCEHALQIVGAARDVVVRDNRMRDFNAHLKVNGEGGKFPGQRPGRVQPADQQRTAAHAAPGGADRHRGRVGLAGAATT